MDLLKLAPLSLALVVTLGTVAVPVAADVEPPPVLAEESAPMVIETEDHGAHTVTVDENGEVVVIEATGSHDHDDSDRTSSAEPEMLDPAVINEIVESYTQAEGAVVSARPFTETGSYTDYTARLVGSGLSVIYVGTYPPADVRTAIEAAVAEWNTVLEPVAGAPVVVEISWEPMVGDDVLGVAGPETMYYGAMLPDPGILYPAGLTNVLLETDANGSGRPEIKVQLNSNRYGAGRWYTGTGTPPPGASDLRSVVAHEVAHGLGFLGSGHLAGHSSLPFVYDTQVTHNGVNIATLTTGAWILTSNNLQLQVSTGVDAKVYAPSTWVAGSSLSHLDDGGGQSSALMTPSITDQDTKRKPDSWVVGLMARIGWPTRIAPIAVSVTGVSTGSTSATVSWSYALTATGLPPDQVKVQAVKGTTVVASATVESSKTSHTLSGLSSETSYTFKVIPIAAGKTGTAATKSATTGEPGAQPDFVADKALDHQVVRIFQAFFLRPPDAAGFEHWRTQRANGVPLIDVYAQFARSAEFVNRYGSLTDGAFVDLVYTNVLGRTPDAAGRSHWVGQLTGGMSRAEMMMRFAESPEFVNRTETLSPYPSTEGQIRRLYQAFFLRPPDATGLAYWMNEVNRGRSLASVAGQFATSTEFVTRYGALTNTQFVDLVYVNVLGRNPDATGRAHWVAQLDRGLSRGSMMVNFSESPENIVRTGTIP